MPQNGQRVCSSMRIVIDAGEPGGGEHCSTQSLRPDIWLGVVAESGAAGAVFSVETPDPVLAIAFLVPRTGKGGEDRLPAGSLCLLPSGRNKLPRLPGRGLHLCVSVPRLTAILGTDASSLPVGVRGLLEGLGGAERVQVTLTPEQVLAGNALILCPHEGAVRNMFLKAKVLELLALFFGQVGKRERSGNAAKLSAHEREVVARAREHLLRHMDSPPGVVQLARHVGVNDSKLKRLFKEAYGLSPYAYLRGERMAAAREMLVKSGVNVSEAATSVGYTNVSHFIDAFTRHYGVRPGELRVRR